MKIEAAVLAFALSCLHVSPALSGDVVVTGVIRDRDTLEPIDGALVSLQATAVRTTSATDGSYALTIPDEINSVIVAAKKGYFNRSTRYTGTPSNLYIKLEAVPQDDDPTYDLGSPFNCMGCHPNQVAEFIDSPMHTNGTNTWLHDIYNGDGTPGGMGGFVYTRDSMFAEANPASECASCHQPEVWIPAPFAAMQTPSDPGYPSDAVQHGVSCNVCHKIAHVDVDRINFPGIYPGAVRYTRPAGPSYLEVQYGMLGDADFSIDFVMRPSYQPQLAAEVCGVCHQDNNDPHETGTYDGVTSEPTYIEWVESPYGDPDSPSYASCVDCHMLPTGETNACEVLFPPLERDPDTIRSHNILGTTATYLENAADLNMNVAVENGALQVQVDVINSQTGHHVPTGVTVRNMILLVEAWREGDGLTLDGTGKQVIHELGGVGDPAQGYYAGLPGKFYAKVNHNKEGQGPTFFTDAFGITFDNRIPALETDTTHYSFAIPEDGGDLHVRARLVYRRAFRFFVDAKQWTEDGHGEPLEDLLPPHFGHLMEMAETVVPTCGVADIDGDLVVGTADLLSMLSAWGACPGCPQDLDGDDVVGVTDLLALFEAWGPCFE